MYLKGGEMFLQVFGFFFKHLNIDVVNILIYNFWLINFFHNQNHPQPLKVGGYFWGTFSNPNDMTQIAFES
jgi:hypothetical protein